MSFVINHIVLVGGNLTKDAELKYANNGNPRLTFSVAMNRKYKDANGTITDVVEFFNIVYWGKIAEAVAPHMTKGQKVAIEGRLSQRRYTGNDGQQHSIVEIAATNVVLIGQRQHSGADDVPPANQPAEQDSGMDMTPMGDDYGVPF